LPTRGHLSLTISDASYQAFANVAFDVPLHPGQAPVHAPAATAASITETNHQYSSNLKEFQVYTSTEASLRKQLIAAVTSTFIHTTYGIITAGDLTANLKELNRVRATHRISLAPAPSLQDFCPHSRPHHRSHRNPGMPN
jgi:hypothetical protein